MTSAAAPPDAPLPPDVPDAPAALSPRLRRAALAVGVLAVLAAGAETMRVVLEILQGASVVMVVVSSGAHLIAALVETALVIAVLALVRAGSLEDRRVLRVSLLALGLITLAQLAAPLAQLIGTILGLIVSDGSSSSGYGLRYGVSTLLSSGGAIVMFLGLGVLALVLLQRASPPTRSVRLPVGPAIPALVLLVAALAAAAAVPLQGLALRFSDLDLDLLLAVNSLFAIVLLLMVALITLCAGLVIALAPVGARRALWVGLGLLWSTQLLGVVLLRAYATALTSGPGGGAEWILGAHMVLGILGPVLLALCVVVALVLLAAAPRRGSPMPSGDPIH